MMMVKSMPVCFFPIFILPLIAYLIYFSRLGLDFQTCERMVKVVVLFFIDISQLCNLEFVIPLLCTKYNFQHSQFCRCTFVIGCVTSVALCSVCCYGCGKKGAPKKKEMDFFWCSFFLYSGEASSLVISMSDC